MITFEHARKYLDKGWSIFPVVLSDNGNKIEKRPAVPWKEYITRLPTLDELHTWFDGEKYNGIGLATGKVSNVVVVDIDDNADHGIYSPLTVSTISGGRHCYFRWTEEIKNTTKINGEHLDFRGDGGFVVLPPSSLGDKKYTWERFVDPMYLQNLPDELKKKLEKKVVNYSTPGDLPFAYEGNRNDTATRVAGTICSGMSRKLWNSIGWEAFRSWNFTHCSPPLGELELRNTWNSISRTEIRNHPAEQPKYAIFSGQEAMENYNQMMRDYGSGLSTGIDQLDKFFKFVPEQLYLLSAPTFQGKTTLALNMAAKIASLGEKVLFCSLEQGVFIAPRVESILGGRFPETLSILTSDKLMDINQITSVVEGLDEKPRVIFIDHLHFIKKQGRGVTEDVDEIIISIQNMAKKLKIPVFVIAHVRKLNADKPPELDDLRDSSSLSQVPSVVMLLYRKRNEKVDDAKSYLSDNGVLFIAKNRIFGKTGALNVTLKEGGEFVFNPSQPKMADYSVCSLHGKKTWREDTKHWICEICHPKTNLI
jgi:hypothetical protein